MATKKKVVKKKVGAKKSSVKKKSTKLNPTGANRRPTNKEKSGGGLTDKKRTAVETKLGKPPKALTFFTPKKKKLFIELLAEFGVVTYACKGVDITKQTAYNARKHDRKFADAWDEAVDYSVENMERVAYDRAVNGVNEPLSFKGELTGDTVKRYSDILLMFMIKGNKPEKYRENSKATNINLNLVPNSLSDDQLMRIAQGATIEGETA